MNGQTTSETYSHIRDGAAGHILSTNTTMQGLTYQYLMANNIDHINRDTCTNASEFPLRGRLELVIWQTYDPASSTIPDPSFKQLTTHPLVQPSLNTINNLTYHGYAISCAAQTSVGHATLSALKNTYSSFQPHPASTQFALQKLFGEVAAASMSSGPGNWTSSSSSSSSEPDPFLRGLETTSTIIPGIIPHIYPLNLLAIWVLMTVLPQLHPSIFFRRR